MKNTTYVIDHEIERLNEKMREENKHLISINTLRRNALKHLESTEDAEYCREVGFNYLIAQRLYANGFRSVREGYHVNLDQCFDIDYLKALSDNAEQSVKEKEWVSAQIRKIRDERCNGQYELSFDEEGRFIGYVENMNEEEFMEKVVSDAV